MIRRSRYVADVRSRRGEVPALRRTEGGRGTAIAPPCGLMPGAPRHEPVLVENRWVPGPDELAVFFGVRELSGMFVKTLRVPATARAYILQGEQATEVPQGEYEIEGFFTRLNHLLRDQHAEILVTRSGALPVEFELDGLRSAEHLEVTARWRCRAHRERAGLRPPLHDDAGHGQKRTPARTAAAPRAPAGGRIRRRTVAARDGGRARTAPAARPAPAGRPRHSAGGVRPGDGAGGDAGAAPRPLRRQPRPHRQPVAGGRRGAGQGRACEPAGRAVHRRRMAPHRARREEARLAQRRTELRQGESLDRAELTLRNAERAQAIRAREIELYGRIVEPRTRKQAIERGAAGSRRGTRTRTDAERRRAPGRGRAVGTTCASWRHSHARRSRRWPARTPPRRARWPQQRFTHQLLQQQIRNKIEQAHGIEDASRQRAELRACTPPRRTRRAGPARSTPRSMRAA